MDEGTFVGVDSTAVHRFYNLFFPELVLTFLFNSRFYHYSPFVIDVLD